MPKQMFTLRNFSGGVNSTKDPRDIEINEFAHLENFFLDENGTLRPSSSLASHDGLVANKSISSKVTGRIDGSAGYNLAYFETDHDTKTNSISNGAISFHKGGETASGGSAVDPSEMIITTETD
tara:strand:- start:392 stop:763 length:372 start_codon:yes stop_codon:yes gene_type:complete